MYQIRTQSILKKVILYLNGKEIGKEYEVKAHIFSYR